MSNNFDHQKELNENKKRMNNDENNTKLTSSNDDDKIDFPETDYKHVSNESYNKLENKKNNHDVKENKKVMIQMITYINRVFF